VKFDQWLVDSAHDYYNDVPIPGIVEKILVEICAGRKEGKSIKDIRFDLKVAGVKVSVQDIRGVLTAHQQHTGESLDVQPNTQ
jgi:hypothetical protein